jgi:cytidylate kinase
VALTDYSLWATLAGMTLAEWIEKQPVQRGLLARLARESGLDYSTVWKIARENHRLDSYSKAKSLSAATGGQVSIEAICEQKEESSSATGTEG